MNDIIGCLSGMNQISSKYNNISDLVRQHQHISKLFNTHQKMLMHGNINQAHETFSDFKKYIKSHIKAENDYLIPLYEKYVSPIPIGGAVEFFVYEHHKINRFIEKFSGLSANLKKISSSADIELVKLFDQHYIFKHLIDHHHTREDTFLFRLLDKLIEESDKSEILIHFSFN
jgi:hemerythrin-like domain-containing protein